MRISKYGNTFAKVDTPDWPEDVFVIKKVKNVALWTCIRKYFNSGEIIGTFYEKLL